MNISIIPNQVNQLIRCSQNDTGLRKWNFTLYQDGDIFVPDGDVSLICSNGEEISMVKDGDVLYCDCTENLSKDCGLFDCKIKIENGDEILHSSLFKLKVERKP